LGETERGARTALLDRLGAVRSVFAPVASDQWYLSKLAVAPNARGRGLGRRLVEAYLRSGEDAAFRRYRVDVEAANAPAIRLYESHGFRVVHDASSDRAGIRYLGMTMEA
jgi:ribosomal protein S18 acetylase RimI-like enzyme